MFFSSSFLDLGFRILGFVAEFKSDLSFAVHDFGTRYSPKVAWHLKTSPATTTALLKASCSCRV